MSRAEAPPTIATVEQAFQGLEALTSDPGLPLDCVQRLLALAVRAYAARAASEPGALPFAADDGAPSETDVAIAASAMLEAVGIEIFELGLWRAWSGMELPGAYE
jgi:hypothetical protein